MMPRNVSYRPAAFALRVFLGRIERWGRLSVVIALACLVTPAAKAQTAVETLVTTARFGDMEFDWGRDGIFCGECNGGDGNARFNWVDRQNRLWISYIDHDTGFFYPPNGRAVLVDTDVAYYSDYGNGPEWAFSQQGSQLVYTRYETGLPYSDETAGIALATSADGVWSASFLDDLRGRISPGPTQSVNDAYPLLTYASALDSRIYWRKLTERGGRERKAPWRSTGLSVRWVPDSGKLAFVNGMPHEDGTRYQQVLLFDSDTRQVEQLTFDPTEKRGVFMFPAPEFDGDLVFFTVAARTELRVFRFMTNAQGGRSWVLVNTIRGPEDAPFIATPEPFIHNGQTYVYMTLSRSNRASDITIPTDLALTGIDPATPSFRRLTDASSPQRLRQDPEYYITSAGPFVYFTRALPATETSGPVNEGVFRLDLGLGPPRR
jgi:hypothetical protein